MLPADFERELKAGPPAFLRRNVFYIFGMPATPNPLLQATAAGGMNLQLSTPPTYVPPRRLGHFSIALDPTMQFQGFQTGLAGRRQETKTRPKYRLQPALAGAAVPVLETWYVPMTQQGDDTLGSYVVLPGRGGPDIALTSQMSGCAFGLGSQTRDGSRLVSHTQPPAGGGGAALRTKASFGATADVFDRQSRPGAGSYGSQLVRATIVGLRTGSRWRFYAQTYDPGRRLLLGVEQLGN